MCVENHGYTVNTKYGYGPKEVSVLKCGLLLAFMNRDYIQPSGICHLLDGVHCLGLQQ